MLVCMGLSLSARLLVNPAFLETVIVMTINTTKEIILA